MHMTVVPSMSNEHKIMATVSNEEKVSAAPGVDDNRLTHIDTTTTMSDGKELRATITSDAGGFTADTSSVPKGYFRDWRYIGTLVAFFLGSCATVGGFTMIAGNLAQINAAIGPSGDITWVALIYTLVLAIGGLLVGRLTDLFGRRWVVLSGSVIGVVGDVVSGSAGSVGALIAGTGVLGLSSAILSSYFYALAELVPMKHRYLLTGLALGATIPLGGFGAVVGKAIILDTPAGWRTCYYMIIPLHVLNFILIFLCYFPPTIEMKFKGRTVAKQLRDLDYLGIVLFTAGSALFVMALNWGGTTYPWKSAHVIACLVVGAVLLIALGFWQKFGKLKEPLLPVHLFKRWSWLATSLNTGLASSGYFSIAILWPMMVNSLYTDDGGASIYAGWLAIIPSTCFNLGQLCAAFFAKRITHVKIQCIFCFAVAGAILASISSCGINDKNRACVLIAFSTWFLGYIDTVMIVNTGLDVDDQQELGTAIGFGTACRTIIPTICSAILISVLGTRLGETIPAVVVPALVQAGLPLESVPAMLAGFASGSFTDVPGVTPTIIGAGAAAYQEAYTQAFHTLWLTTLAFTMLGMVLSVFTKNTDDLMTEKIAVTVQTGKRGGVVQDAEKGVEV